MPPVAEEARRKRGEQRRDSAAPRRNRDYCELDRPKGDRWFESNCHHHLEALVDQGLPLFCPSASPKRCSGDALNLNNFRVISASVQRPVGIKQYKVEIQDEKGKIQLVFFRIITVSIYFSILLVLTVCSFLGSNLLQ